MVCIVQYKIAGILAVHLCLNICDHVLIQAYFSFYGDKHFF